MDEFDETVADVLVGGVAGVDEEVDAGTGADVLPDADADAADDDEAVPSDCSAPDVVEGAAVCVIIPVLTASIPSFLIPSAIPASMLDSFFITESSAFTSFVELGTAVDAGVAAAF